MRKINEDILLICGTSWATKQDSVANVVSVMIQRYSTREMPDILFIRRRHYQNRTTRTTVSHLFYHLLLLNLPLSPSPNSSTRWLLFCNIYTRNRPSLCIWEMPRDLQAVLYGRVLVDRFHPILDSAYGNLAEYILQSGLLVCMCTLTAG